MTPNKKRAIQLCPAGDSTLAIYVLYDDGSVELLVNYGRPSNKHTAYEVIASPKGDSK